MGVDVNAGVDVSVGVDNGDLIGAGVSVFAVFIGVSSGSPWNLPSESIGVLRELHGVPQSFMKSATVALTSCLIQWMAALLRTSCDAA